MAVKPNLFIVGQPKSGTSALFSFLKQHRDISVCKIKEPQFFGTDINSTYFYMSKTEQTLDNYLGLFADDGKTYHLEASTAYLFSETAAANIHSFNPDAKIIIMLREPVDFLFTYHRQLLRNSVKSEVEQDFHKALALEAERREGKNLPKNVFNKKFLLYSERVRYVEHIRRFARLFKNDQIKIIIYDDFKKDNRAIYLSVLEFLALDASNLPEFTTVNKQVAVRSRVAKQYFDKQLYPIKLWVKHNLSESKFAALRAFYRRMIFSSKALPALSNFEKNYLKARYIDQVAQLSEYLDRNLMKEWGYEDIQRKLNG
jgi:hypothetical protein